MKIVTLTRRQFLTIAGVSAAGRHALLHAQPGQQSLSQQSEKGAEPPTIRSHSRFSDALWCFDPIGLYVQPGETVRFISTRIGITTLTAYHPRNDNHELRIPETAVPFDLGYPEKLLFDWKFEVEGTYDYFSKYQEVLGMIGRIVVGRPGGPGEKPWGYGGRDGRSPIYEAVLKTTKLLDSREIVSKKTIPFPFDAMLPGYPLWD